MTLSNFCFSVSGIGFLFCLPALVFWELGQAANIKKCFRTGMVFERVGFVCFMLGLTLVYMFGVFPAWYALGNANPYGNEMRELAEMIGAASAHGVYLIGVIALTLLLFGGAAWIPNRWARICED